MRVLKISVVAAALTLALSAPGFAQTVAPKAQPPATPPAVGAPKPQPPATPPAVAAPKPQPPAPFPQDAKIAFIDVNLIAGSSSAGKEASKRLSDLTSKKSTEINDRNKQLQALTAKRDSGGGLLSAAARAHPHTAIQNLHPHTPFP